MINNEKLTFTMTNEKNEEILCEVLFTFDSDETNKSYMVYTDHTVDENNNTRVYAQTYDPNSETLDLVPIESDKEWKMIEILLDGLREQILESQSNQSSEQ